MTKTLKRGEMLTLAKGSKYFAGKRRPGRPVTTRPLVSLVEFAPVSGGRVDEEAGVIRGVKVLGRTSLNDREYTDRAMQEAADLYEGVSVFIDHPTRPEGDRELGDKFGHLTNVEVKESGVFADLVFLKSHPMAQQVVEAAQRMPGQLGLSHNADGEVIREGGRTLVQRIHAVRSVDLVSNPATNAGLFESERANMTTVKKLAKGLEQATIGKAYLLEMLADEMIGDPVGDAEVDVAPEASAEEQVDTALQAAAMAVVADPNIDPKETGKKVAEILAAKDKILGGMEPAADEEEEEVSESYKKQIATLSESVEALKKAADTANAERDEIKAKDDARQQLEEAGREATEVRVEAVAAAAGDEDKQKSLIESWPVAAPKGSRPKRSPGIDLTESVEYPKTHEDFLAACK